MSCKEIKKSHEIKTNNEDISDSSDKWSLLLKKVEDLKFAIRNQNIMQISIIYNSLEKELSKFNPKDYFPEIFFDVYLNLNPVMSKILKFTENNFESVEWYLANNLYSLNPSKFLDEEISFSSSTWTDLKFIAKNHEKTNNTLIGDYFEYVTNNKSSLDKNSNSEKSIDSNKQEMDDNYNDNY